MLFRSWERAPDSARSWYVGKSGFPTLMFNVSVTHDGKILNVSGPNPGARNDKMAVRWDNFVQSIRDKSLYGDITQVPRVVARFASVVWLARLCVLVRACVIGCLIVRCIFAK